MEIRKILDWSGDRGNALFVVNEFVYEISRPSADGEKFYCRCVSSRSSVLNDRFLQDAVPIRANLLNSNEILHNCWAVRLVEYFMYLLDIHPCFARAVPPQPLMHPLRASFGDGKIGSEKQV